MDSHRNNVVCLPPPDVPTCTRSQVPGRARVGLKSRPPGSVEADEVSSSITPDSGELVRTSGSH